MPGVWCPRCRSNVILEQDGCRCSNCKRILVIAVPEPPKPTPKPAPTSPDRSVA